MSGLRSLNEGRDRDPGDTSPSGCRGTGDSPRAQRRPGSRPRRHPQRPAGNVPLEIRSTKAGIETPATQPVQLLSATDPAPLNEGRDRDPGDTTENAACPGCSCALNEGRDRDPGDTSPVARSSLPLSHAQRRPGSRPRRHTRERAYELSGHMGAQRRPGSRPRRHAGVQHGFTHARNRSTKAGIETPATPSRSTPRRGRPRRSTKAGIETPATP